ncbi:MAG: acyltransferase [Acidobacteriota bacterium]
MKIKTLGLFIFRPGTLLKSFYYSCRHCSVTRLWDAPISASWPTSIKRERDSKLNIRGKLRLGLFTTQLGEIGQIRYDRTIVQLAQGSELIIDGEVSLGPGVRVIAGAGSRISIGNNSFISNNSKILCKERIEIGHECSISWDVQIIDTDFHSHNGDRHSITAPIVIGNRVWIGTGTTILKGVVIGDGAIIGAGSLVNKNVPPKTLVAGNPAQVIRDNVEWKL